MQNTKTKITKLFNNLCCSQCKSDFREDSIEIVRKEDSMLVVKLHCCECGKTFGLAFLGINSIEVKDDIEPLEMVTDLPPITKDDVLDASIFIQNLDEHWTKYLP